MGLTPSIVGACNTPGLAQGVYVAGSYAYVADGIFLQVLDISNPANPTMVGACFTPGLAMGVYVAGTYAYVAGALLQVIDISNPANPTIVGACNMPAEFSSTGVYVAGTYVYVANLGSGLQVIDISNPANPTIVGACFTPGLAMGVYVTGSYAYVSDGESGLQVIDISNPANPSFVGACDTPDAAAGVHVTGSYAYVSDGKSGLQVIDISNPANPTIVGACDTPGAAYNVYVAGSYAYVADMNSGLQVIDISNPANPTIVGACDTPFSANDVYVAGSYAYVSDSNLLESAFQVMVMIEKFLPLTDIQYMDSGTLTATVPAGYRPGTYDLHVTNPDGGHAVLHGAFTVEDAWDMAYKTLVDDSSDLGLLRQYRDHFLTKSIKGKLYTSLLYQSSEKALKVLLDHPALMRRANNLIRANKRAVANVLNGAKGVLENTDAVISFLKAYGKKSPPALRFLTKKVMKEMRKKQSRGRPFLGFTLE